MVMCEICRAGTSASHAVVDSRHRHQAQAGDVCDRCRCELVELDGVLVWDSRSGLQQLASAVVDE